MHASLNPAIFRRWPFPVGSQQSEPRGFGDGGRARRATELAANVRDVAVNGVRAEHQLLGDLAIAETACHLGEHLALAR